MIKGRDSPTQGGVQMLQLLQVYSQTDRKSRKGLSNGTRFSDIKNLFMLFQRNGLTAQPKCAIIQMLSEGKHSKKPLLGKRRSSMRRRYASGSDVSEPKSKSAHSKKNKKKF